MAWPTKAQRSPAQPFDQADSSVETSVATLDNIVPETPEEAQNLDIQIRQAETLDAEEARLLALVAASEQLRLAQIRRVAEQEARDVLESQRLHDAVEGLRRIEAQKQAERARTERDRIAKIAEEYEQSGALDALVSGAIEVFEAQKLENGVEALRSAFADMFRVPAPPAPLWQSDSPLTGECILWNGRIRVHLDIRPGLDGHVCILSGIAAPLDGVGALAVTSRSQLARYISEYSSAAELFNVAQPEQAKLDGTINIAAYGAQR